MLVCCIDAKNHADSKIDVEKYLVLNNIYTVIDSVKYSHDQIVYLLFEIQEDDGYQLWFNSRRFRTIDTPNISLFEKMLKEKVVSVPNVNDDNPYIKEFEKAASY